MEKAAIELKIHLELLRARTKHPKWPKDIRLQAGILAEEAGEVLKAANDCYYNGVPWKETRRRIIKEAVQTGAMVQRLLENLPDEEWQRIKPIDISKMMNAKRVIKIC